MTPDTDPYVCFRRREIKNLRKARRSDTFALDKVRKLREDLERTKELLQLVAERENERLNLHESFHLIIEKQIHVRRLKIILGIKTPDVVHEDLPRKRLQSITNFNESTQIRIPLHRLRDAANLVSDLDLNSMTDSIAANEGLTIEDRVRQIRISDTKAGYIDLTEVH